MRKILIGTNKCLSKTKQNNNNNKKKNRNNNPNLSTCQPKATINTTKVE